MLCASSYGKHIRHPLICRSRPGPLWRLPQGLSVRPRNRAHDTGPPTRYRALRIRVRQAHRGASAPAPSGRLTALCVMESGAICGPGAPTLVEFHAVCVTRPGRSPASGQPSGIRRGSGRAGPWYPHRPAGDTPPGPLSEIPSVARCSGTVRASASRRSAPGGRRFPESVPVAPPPLPAPSAESPAMSRPDPVPGWPAPE